MNQDEAYQLKKWLPHFYDRQVKKSDAKALAEARKDHEEYKKQKEAGELNKPVAAKPTPVGGSKSDDEDGSSSQSDTESAAESGSDSELPSVQAPKKKKKAKIIEYSSTSGNESENEQPPKKVKKITKKKKSQAGAQFIDGEAKVSGKVHDDEEKSDEEIVDKNNFKTSTVKPLKKKKKSVKYVQQDSEETE